MSANSTPATSVGRCLAEGALAGLAFGVADALAGGVTRLPLLFLALVLSSATAGGLAAGLWAGLVTRRVGAAVGWALFFVALVDALAFASRELVTSRVGFLVALPAAAGLAGWIAACVWRQRPTLPTALALMTGVPLADLLRRELGAEGSSALLLATLFVPAAIALALWGLPRRRSRAALLFGLFAVLVSVLQWPPPQRGIRPLPLDSAAARAPNVCLLVVDTLRADHVTTSGDPATSAFARLARDGVFFPQTIASAPWTLPSMASLLTALHPTQHGALSISRPLPAELVTLAERFAQAGYDTAAFTGGAFVSSVFGLDQGFRTFDGNAEYRFQASPRHVPLVWHVVRNRWFPQRWILRHLREFGGVQEMLGRVRAWLDERPTDRPFFLLVHTYEVHDYYLYDPPADDPLRAAEASPFGSRLSVHPAELNELSQTELDWFQRVYRARIEHVDRGLARLLDDLQASTSNRELVLALTADHGEGFDADRGRVHHGGRLHDDLLRVPLFVRAPEWPAGRVVDEQVRLVDLGPTLLELAGLPAPSEVSGRSFVHAVEGRGEWPTPAWSEERGGLRSMRAVPWKLMGTVVDQAALPEGTSAEPELYDLTQNPAELRAQALSIDVLPGELLELWEGFGSLYPARPAREQAIDRETEAQLRALGYTE